MSRKTHSLSAAALIAATSLTFASAELSGAVAQDADIAGETAVAEEPGEVVTPSTTLPELGSAETSDADSAQPVFVSQEVVQTLSDKGTDASDIAAPKASSLKQLVAATNTQASLSEQMQCLAGAVYFESRGEPLAGQLAVAQVVINRAESRRFPESYCGVVYQRAQFSFVKNGRMPRIKTGSKAWRKAKAIARIAHEGRWESEAQDSLYFHATYVRPSWSRKKVARATIKTHIFYR